MTKQTSEQMVKQTMAWVRSFIIEYNVCPFAEYTVNQGTVATEVIMPSNTEEALEALIESMIKMDKNSSIETTLLLYPDSFACFDEYLDFASLAESLISVSGYDGIYQLATFHPQYCFEGVLETDVSNYTNRSPYPMLHVLRESSIEKAIEHYGDTSAIPDNNIETMHKLGLDKITALLNL